MSEKNMTALVSCFVRAYHFNNCKPLIFSDYPAKKILTPEEYLSISTKMKLLDGLLTMNSPHPF